MAIGGASQDGWNDVREPRHAALRVASAYRRRASGSLADALNRLRLPSYPAKSGRDLYESLSLLLGIIHLYRSIQQLALHPSLLRNFRLAGYRVYRIDNVLNFLPKVRFVDLKKF